MALRLPTLAGKTLPIPYLIERTELNRKQELPEVMGVYFIFDSVGTILYIGCSININRRIRQHTVKHKQGSIFIQKRHFPLEEAKEVSYVATEDNLEEMSDAEVYYIEKYRPKYNPDSFLV